MRFAHGYNKTELSGQWQFIYTDDPITAVSIDEINAMNIPVFPAEIPGNFELDLFRNGIIPNPYHGANIKILREYEKKHIAYFSRFNYIKTSSACPYIVFEGLDCLCEIFINGQHVLSSDNMLIPHEVNIETFITEGNNEILVQFTPPSLKALEYDYPAAVSGFHANYESLYIRKPAHMFGWDILPRIISAGIFRPLYIEERPAVSFVETYLQTSSLKDRSAESMFFYKCNFTMNPGDIWSIRLSGQCRDSKFREEFRLSFQYGKHLFKIENPLLWYPRGAGESNLYNIKAELLMNGIVRATTEFTHGIRTIELVRQPIIKKDETGEFSFRINNRDIFIKGTNWVAADAFHSRDRERIPHILDMAADLNCNMIRCWGGNLYEDDIFYEICDREGILIWQDFAMACAVYPQDRDFQERLETEAVSVIKRLRQHPCLALWAGDNECDQAHSWFGFNTDPNTNILTRVTLPNAVRQHDPFRSYLPSSPYLDPYSFGKDDAYLPENHLWGKRDYYKSDYYAESTNLFSSEMGYHGCPSPESIREFISADCVWPYDNEEWLLHSTSPLPEIDKRYNFRVELMANQIKVLFGSIPDNIDDFAKASQASQGEAKKFFIELFRCGKTERTGILWWNLMDGWPQFSDAIVDYYFNRKTAYDFIKRSQRDILLTFREPVDGYLELIASNLTDTDSLLDYSVTDADTGKTILKGTFTAPSDSKSSVDSIDFPIDKKAFYIIRWTDSAGEAMNHYLAGSPPFDFNWYTGCLNRLSQM